MLSLFLLTCLSIPLFYFIRCSRSTPLRLFVSLHTLILIHNAIVHPPPNIFTRLHLPLSMPTDSLRALLLKHSQDPTLPKPIEQLLRRMNSFDTRTLYVRFGHDALALCDFCRSYGDFALYALPKTLIAYIREVAVIGLLTIRGTGHEQWRIPAVCLLIAVAGAEAYIRSTVVIQIKEGEDVFMWNDMLEIARAVVFVAIPIIIDCILPVRAYASPPHPAESVLQSLSTRLHALKYYRGAIMRSPTLNGNARLWWDRQRKEGEWIREDGHVQAIARGIGIPYEGPEPKLRATAQDVAGEFVRLGIPPSANVGRQ